MQSVATDAAFSMVCVCVCVCMCVSVCLSVLATWMNCTKMAEMIEIEFGLQTLMMMMMTMMMMRRIIERVLNSPHATNFDQNVIFVTTPKDYTITVSFLVDKCVLLLSHLDANCWKCRAICRVTCVPE